MARIPVTWYPEPGTWHPCIIPTSQILTRHYHPGGVSASGFNVAIRSYGSTAIGQYGNRSMNITRYPSLCHFVTPSNKPVRTGRAWIRPWVDAVERGTASRSGWS